MESNIKTIVVLKKFIIAGNFDAQCALMMNMQYGGWITISGHAWKLTTCSLVHLGKEKSFQALISRVVSYILFQIFFIFKKSVKIDSFYLRLTSLE